MASLLFRPFLRLHTLGFGAGLCLASLRISHQRPSLLDSTAIESSRENSRFLSFQKTRLNPKVVRQISSGSIIGLCAGLAVSIFSRSLALLIGLLVIGVQWVSSYDIDILPYAKLRRYVTSMDIQSAMHENVGFKLSFGTTFALAAFMHF